MKRVLFVFQEGWAPHFYVRGLLFKDLFEREGIDVRYIPRSLTPPKILTASPRPFIQILQQSPEYQVVWWLVNKPAVLMNDRRIVSMARHMDAVHLIKVDSLDLVKRIRARSKARIIYDVSDTHPYSPKAQKTGELVKAADAATYDCQATFEYAKRFNTPLFHWPPPSQVELFEPLRKAPKPSGRDGRITIGWVGSWATTVNLYRVWDALEEIFRRHSNVHIRLLGASSMTRILPAFERVSFSILPQYTPRQMIEEVSKMDIGIYPLFANEHARVHGFLKALIYMSGEAAVISSPVGECASLIKDGQNGFLADSTADWVEKISLLITDYELRRRMAAAGLETARSKDYSLENGFNRLRLALGV